MYKPTACAWEAFHARPKLHNVLQYTLEVIVKMDRSAWDISLSCGETRVVYIPPRALILGVKGHATVVERVDGLGDASFSLCIPLRGGETYVLAYGGHVMVRAAKSCSLRVLPPQPLFAAWRARCVRMARALQHTAAALNRRLHGA
ncbi:hypothetical protein AKI39_08785 [Bordetella sp. H567]|uniref:hypothetical protein n=1 Tax=Bordetella sp. H567 TaxID=1697043 RepID=UPI00081CE95A|nr:hypothetical protein [Bordetella sp. H567]AOB30769.1 hypothetical protein AKI39_08785 [Bordetella sp. H567]